MINKLVEDHFFYKPKFKQDYGDGTCKLGIQIMSRDCLSRQYGNKMLQFIHCLSSNAIIPGLVKRLSTTRFRQPHTHHFPTKFEQKGVIMITS